MTLDCGCKLTIKGHFCSLLVSNIFCNPLFPSLPLATSPLHAKPCSFLSQARIPSVSVAPYRLQKANRFFLFPERRSFVRNTRSSFGLLLIYVHLTWTDLNASVPFRGTLHIALQTSSHTQTIFSRLTRSNRFYCGFVGCLFREEWF